MARMNLIRKAERPKMNARALFQGPQGSGKTWTMLSVARSLIAGTSGRILGIDTERESMLTYADVFDFQHLPWRPPYSPDELTQTLDQIAAEWVETPDDVVLIDSSSHFWQGTGGILDIAGGKVQGGWDKARPMQQALVEQLLAMPCHVLLGARMKNTVLVSDGGKTIENVGLTITQDESLGYELNIVVQMDMNHSISVMKSRTPAVPVGRVYPGGHEGKLATDYAEWLAGGIPPANREDVEAIVEVFAGIADRERRKILKDAFVEEFGMPHSLTAEQVPAAREWLVDQGAAVGQGPAAGDEAEAPADDEVQPEPEETATVPHDPDESPEDEPTAEEAPEVPEAAQDAEEAPEEPETGEEAPEEPGEPETGEEAVPTAEETEALRVKTERTRIVGQIRALKVADVKEALREAGQIVAGNGATCSARLAAYRFHEAGVATPEESALVKVAEETADADGSN